MLKFFEEEFKKADKFKKPILYVFFFFTILWSSIEDIQHYGMLIEFSHFFSHIEQKNLFETSRHRSVH